MFARCPFYSLLTLDMSGSATKKEYILVSSDNKAPDSASTTDFTLRMLVPIPKVIKTDLIQVSMDYNMANITSPDNFFTIGDGGATSSYVVIEEGLYTIDVLASWLQQQLTTELGAGVTVYYTVNSKLMIELKAQSNADNVALSRLLNFSSAKLSYTLGITNSPVVAGSLTPV